MLFTKKIINKLLTVFGVFILGLFVFSTSFKSIAEASTDKQIYFFYGEGCSHCNTVKKFFNEEDIYNRYPLVSKEIYSDRENSAEFNKRLDILNIPISERGVPAVFIGGEVFIGDFPIIDNFEKKADAFLEDIYKEISDLEASAKEDTDQGVVTEIDENKEVGSNISDEELIEKSSSTSITLAAVLAGSIVDAVNPCAFAVLIILMMTVMASGDSSRALKTGLAFSSSIFISYLLMGVGLYSALSSGNFGDYFTKGVGVLAIILGLFNLKDWLWYGKGMLMEVPMSWRPTMKKLIRSTTSPLGAFLVGFLVSLFLLPCTSGPYIVVLGMLSDSVQRGKAFLYMILYNLVFVSPMVIISYLVHKGYDPKKLENLRKKNLKNLHLIAGVILIGMGWFLLV